MSTTSSNAKYTEIVNAEVTAAYDDENVELSSAIYPTKGGRGGGIKRRKTRRDPSAQPSRAKKICKCCLIGLLVMTLLGLLVAGIAALGGYIWTKHQVRRFTVTQPNHDNIPPQPKHPMTDAQLQVVKDRAVLFWDTLKAGGVPAEPFVITADELNGFANHCDYLRGNLYVTLQENSLKMDMSLPMEHFPGGRGRYFVGTGTLNVAPAADSSSSGTEVTAQLDARQEVPDTTLPFLLAKLLVLDNDNDKVVVNLLQGEVFGGKWTAPQDFIDEHENLLDDLYEEHPEEARVLKAIQSVTITNQAIVVTPSAPASSASSSAQATSTTTAQSNKYGGTRKLRGEQRSKSWKKFWRRALL